MKISNIFDAVAKWDQSVAGESASLFSDLHALITFRDRHSFSEYHPSIGPYPCFEERLLNWLNSVEDEEYQKLLLRLIPEIFYIGRDEFVSLYRSAFNEFYLPWVIDKSGLDFTQHGFDVALESAVNKTWFCPITDSLHISDFFHVNNLSGISNRPDWYSLCKFGDKDLIAEYIDSNEISFLVLMEDFVGSGSQIIGKDGVGCTRCEDGVVGFASSNFPDLDILILPLVICPVGFQSLSFICKKYTNIDFASVLKITDQVTINYDSTKDLPDASLRKKVYKMLEELKKEILWPFGPYGFHNTGSLTVMYSNCPDNTLSFIHASNDKWQALFPRSSRI